ncbi:hypothetical protein FCL53_16895 [Elizabethkingia meningoseptica]|uniref:hypothetical protein n=1 Tax=Elizabethkingia meningoseptica TaxID=238 RepID=UPI001365C29B|nr:hypothetical protein [Elizabethkingia meningoseptica]MVW93641.1 hypothetical protein [Elizabethkingia meningoseptica]
MAGTNNVLYQDNIGQEFKLVVVDSKYNGTYDIEQPEGFDEVNCFVDINEEFFNVDNFIIGDSTNLEFIRYNNMTAYDIIDKVYNEKGGDGQIIFKWFVNGDDILGDDFQINLNKFSRQYEQSSLKIVTEIKKRESQNKIYSREDTSVNLFADKNLDNNPIVPVQTKEVYFKEIRKNTSNFYFFSAENSVESILTKGAQRWQWLYKLSGDRNLGDNVNIDSGYYHKYQTTESWFAGDMLSTKIDIEDFQITISNLEVYGFKVDDTTYHKMHLVAVIKDISGVVVRIVKLEDSVPYTSNNFSQALIKIETSKTYTNQTIGDLNNPTPLSLKPGQSIEISFMRGFTPDSEYDPNATYFWRAAKQDTSIKIQANLLAPLRKVKVVSLKDAMNQLCKAYSDGNISVESNILGPGGIYENTGIGTGIQLRGLTDVFKYTDKLTTSFDALFGKGVAPLFAFGFDILGNKLIVENVDYYFKDIQMFDFSNKGFDEDGYNVANDLENSFNNLKFGCKKYSTNKDNDLRNYNTDAELLTPIKSTKNNLDKTTDLIIDEFKIQEITTDDSTRTSDSDDDVILIDLVKLNSYTDNGLILACVHEMSEGNLVLRSYKTPFDLLPLNVGDSLNITSGLNAGDHTIIKKETNRLELTTTTTIERGTSNTPIKYTVHNLTKNRSDEGFVYVNEGTSGTYSRDTTSNLRHNPKFQMARWSGFFGSSLVKKLSSEEIIMTKYKNNGTVEVEVDPTALPNEITGRVTLGSNETVGRMRNFKYPYFTNEIIEITIPFVEFYEFMMAYRNWRFGKGGDINQNRGYFTVDTPNGVVDVYPFGQKGLEFNKRFNTLTIRGKIKGSALRNKITHVEFKSEVTGTWETTDGNGNVIDSGDLLEYKVSMDIDTPDSNLPIAIYSSKDNGNSWTKVYTGSYSPTVEFWNEFFNDIPKNRKVGFRVFSVDNDFQQYKSDDVFIPYPFGSVVVNVTKVITNPDEANCGYTYMEYELVGEGTINVDYRLYSEAGNGSLVILDEDDNIVVEIIAPINSSQYNENKSGTITLNGTSRFKATFRAASSINSNMLTCYNNGNESVLAYMSVGIDFIDNGVKFYGIGSGAFGRKYKII